MSSSLKYMIELACKREEESGNSQYIVRTQESYIITERMPMFGEWYTSDGIRHGQ